MDGKMPKFEDMAAHRKKMMSKMMMSQKNMDKMMKEAKMKKGGEM